MLSKAKHLWIRLFALAPDDLRFFASLRMTEIAIS